MNLNEEVRSRRHQLFLEALRYREQEVFRYLVIMGPALGGFAWLLDRYRSHYIDITTFSLGTIGLVALLLLGACYCIALGYNYRYLTFQISKEEDDIGVSETVLKAWPRGVDRWSEWTNFGHYHELLGKLHPKLADLAWCFPPGLIAVFWFAFMLGQVFLTVVAFLVSESAWIAWLAWGMGIACIGVTFVVPWWHGRKLRRLVLTETQPDNAKAAQPNPADDDNDDYAA
jgi:hypothetical protein